MTTKTEKPETQTPEVKEPNTELAKLKAENERLKTENALFRSKLPVGIEPKEGHSIIFVKSNNVPYLRKNGAKYVEGSVNGVPFEVECDKQVQVRDDIASALKGVIEAQNK